MFRALGGRKFELLLRDLIGTLQPCLNMLLAMLDGPTAEETRDLLLELCLTLPSRLCSLLPDHLPRLMKPLVVCLNGSDELVSLGLRTLGPAPYPWGGKSLQLLRKLGSHNRRFLKEPLALECKENPEHGLRLILTFESETPFLVPLDRCINLAISDPDLPGRATDDGLISRHLSTVFVSSVDWSWRKSEASDVNGLVPPRFSLLNNNARSIFLLTWGVNTKTQVMAEKSIFTILLMTIIAASAEPDSIDPKDDYVTNVFRHFAIIFHLENSSTTTPISAIFLGGPLLSNLKELDPLIFLDALVEVLADENRLHAKAALNALNVFCKTFLLLARSKHADVIMSRSGPGTRMIVSIPSMSPIYLPPPIVRVPIFDQLLPRILHCCYGSSWQAQMGGIIGFGALVGKAFKETHDEIGLEYTMNCRSNTSLGVAFLDSATVTLLAKI
ncbi:transformation/transcription domain-associated protein-like protein [Tanacetum coccineum]